MAGFLSFMYVACGVLTLVFGIWWFRKRKSPDKPKWLGATALIMFVAGFCSYSLYTNTPEGKAEQAQEDRQDAKEYSIDQAKKKQFKKTVYKNTHVGIKGLNYQVKQSLKKDGIDQYKVSTKGIDTTKPYTAVVTLNKADGYMYGTAKVDALTALKGIKKIDYKDFSNIEIMFTTTMVNNYGNETKNVPVLKYGLSKEVISKSNPDNMTDLKDVATSYSRKPLK